jgi:anti-sigma factor ChrR (cupin superfamily)
MKIHTDLKLRVIANTADMPWAPSPVYGIDRKMLERDGDEIARATSLVRYEPNSSFTPHQHELGEEFLVLDGEFQDELGQYPAGTYVKIPLALATLHLQKRVVRCLSNSDTLILWILSE